MVLSWQFNQCTLQISLPNDKHIAWQSDIKAIKLAKHGSIADLNALMGRLNHVGMIIPLARYFLNRIRREIDAALQNCGSRAAKHYKKWLSKSSLQDLELLAKTFLPKAHSSISMNLITYCRASHVLFSDACPGGLGGYSANMGSAWHWEVPDNFKEDVENKSNLLEFMAAVITVWVPIHDRSITPKS